MVEGELKLLGARADKFTIRVRIILAQKGLNYEYLDYFNKSELLLEHNPIYKEVPVLIHDDRSICGSLVILQYIDENWPGTGPALLPTDPYERAVARFWAAYIDDKDGVYCRCSAHDQRGNGARNLKQIETKSGKIGMGKKSGRFTLCQLAGQDYSAGGKLLPSFVGILKATEETRTQKTTDTVAALEQLEGAFKKCFAEKNFFGGDSIGFVDVILGCQLTWMKAAENIFGIKLLDETKVPLLVKWEKHFLAADFVKCVMPSVESIEEDVRLLRATIWNIDQLNIL